MINLARLIQTHVLLLAQNGILFSFLLQIDFFSNLVQLFSVCFEVESMVSIIMKEPILRENVYFLAFLLISKPIPTLPTLLALTTLFILIQLMLPLKLFKLKHSIVVQHRKCYRHLH